MAALRFFLQILLSLILLVVVIDADGSSIADFIDEHINSKEVLIFSKTRCPYCVAAKHLLNRINKKKEYIVTVVEIDEKPQEQQTIYMDELYRRTNQRTVPNIFIGGKHVGGNDHVQALYRQGELEKMLKELRVDYGDEL
eukprot:CAMPEP_0172502542 /NCGR_PEP_ID=MMETSP1066-20121228/160974_1 /TAXON_ID=671091 /ORGANISM="Coscinodiscus wailesii, Strain CCMP2513" /LENGTH=139 /DNA_ID=CAMNT_0013277841 /DNA_START=68 /DNA_END=487 /DNA_ORIENTATION=+